MVGVSGNALATADCAPVSSAAVIAANPKAASDFRGGKQQTLGFLVGQVMKVTKGKANPAMVNDLMRKLLAGG